MSKLPIEIAKIDYDDRNVPIARRFDDPYYSFNDGLGESEYVFIQGNDLADRLVDGFHVAELGFGTGLNFLLLWAAWRATGRAGKVYMTSFEAYPMDEADRQKSLERFPQVHELARLFSTGFDGTHFDGADIQLTVVIGDARATLPNWPHLADAWFLDGFSPAKNPEMWEDDLMASVAAHTTPNGSFATYSAAGHVRNKLASAGFAVERIKGYGHKRHMTRGRLKG